ncbi:MAG: gfo/Idh/MocA family oxidoreductase [Gammaproteobacteria bacterium]|nr:gfo/Idh/MocA family oxidoreductase [Gammaproteobacteria bacterium]
MSRIRCGVIGVGYLGRFHAQKYATHPNVRLMGVYDVHHRQAETVSHELKIKAYSQLEEMIQEVDAVSIAAITPAHFEIAQYCLEKGVHVLVEKPITQTLQEAMILNQLAKEKSLVLQVGHLERFNPAYSEFIHYLNQPQWIEAQRLAPFKKRGCEVDVVLDLMIHDLDIILSLVPSEVVDIDAKGISIMTSAIDLATIGLKFANGCIAQLTASRVHSSVERVMRVYQENDYFALDFQQQKLTKFSLNAYSETESYFETELIPTERQDPLNLQINNFVKTVLKQAKPAVDGVAGAKALELALRIQQIIQSTRDATICV